jgi:tetratricopeptide (TPR) repeat protein
MYYRYTQKWVDLFHSQPLMIRVETGHYIKGLHSLLNAHFDLRNFQKFEITLKEFEAFAETERVVENDSFRIQAFIYIASAKINQHCMIGTFKEGLPLVPGIEEKMNDYALFIDTHRILVLNYKIAALYFGSGDYDTSIDYLQKIINDNTDLRGDLQCYARLVHLLAHYELGNTELMESLVRSVYRFMAKMENLTVVEEEMLKFLRNSFNGPPKKIKPELEILLNKIKHLEKNRFETRAFAYLDIISWLESKVYEKPMSTIIYDKYLKSRKRIYH